MEIMKYSHTLGHVQEPLFYPIPTPSDLRKEGIVNRFNELYNQAQAQYNFRQCHFSYNIPEVRLEEDEKITIAINWPQDIELTTTGISDRMIIDHHL